MCVYEMSLFSFVVSCNTAPVTLAQISELKLPTLCAFDSADLTSYTAL